MNIIHAECRKIREDDLRMLMDWRMRPDITKYMNTNPQLSLEGQNEWYRKIKEDEKKGIKDGRKNFYWILEVDEVPSGFVSLVNMDYQSKKIETGVYVAEKSKRSLYLAMDLQWNLYRYSFEKLGMNKVCEEVFAENKAVNRILDMCGSVREGVLRSHVYKEGIYYDVVVRGILRSEWEEKKKSLEYNVIEFE